MKDLDVFASQGLKKKYVVGNMEPITETTSEALKQEDLQDLDVTVSENFKESYLIEKIDLYADVKLAYLVLKKGPVISDPDEFYDSLTKLLTAKQVSNFIDDLKQQSEYIVTGVTYTVEGDATEFKVEETM